jgi:hypothetical protein
VAALRDAGITGRRPIKNCQVPNYSIERASKYSRQFVMGYTDCEGAIILRNAARHRARRAAPCWPQRERCVAPRSTSAMFSIRRIRPLRRAGLVGLLVPAACGTRHQHDPPGCTSRIGRSWVLALYQPLNADPHAIIPPPSLTARPRRARLAIPATPTGHGRARLYTHLVPLTTESSWAGHNPLAGTNWRSRAIRPRNPALRAGL